MTARKPIYRKIEDAAPAREARRVRDGARKIRYRCRCANWKCQHRETFRGLPWLKKRPPVCICGSQRWRIDWYRMLTETSRTRCDCGGRSFPHRRGSCGVPKYLK